MQKPNADKGEWAGFKIWDNAMKKYGTKLPARETDRTRRIYEIGKEMLEGDDSTRTFNLNIDSATEISVNGIIKYNMNEANIGDKLVFTFSMMNTENKHPNYYPWHMLVVTKDKISKIK